MPIGVKGSRLIVKDGRLADGCRCCGACAAACTDLLSEIEISVSAPANSGMPWTNTAEILLSQSKQVGGAFWPAMYGAKQSIEVDAVDDSVVIPASLISTSTPLTEITGAAEQITATVFGCTVALTVTQTTESSLVWADTYYATDNNDAPLYLIHTKGTPVSDYELLTKETRSVTVSFSLALWREVFVNRYWDAMDNAVFPSGTAWRNNKTWVSTAASGNCDDYESSFSLTETTAGYLSSVAAGDEYNGIGLGGISYSLSTGSPYYGRQIRIADNFTASVAIR